MKAQSVIIKVKKDNGKPSLIDYKSSTNKKLKNEASAIIKSMNPKKTKRITGIYGDL